MKCNIEGRPGQHKEWQLVHTARHRGQVIVTDRVPAGVYSACGDVRPKPETVRRIEELVRTAGKSARTVPLYEYV